LFFVASPLLFADSECPQLVFTADGLVKKKFPCSDEHWATLKGLYNSIKDHQCDHLVRPLPRTWQVVPNVIKVVAHL
jgi:hypothetical protein